MTTHTLTATITFEDEQAPNTERFEQAEDTAVRELASFLEALSTGHRVGTLVVSTDGGDAVAAQGSVSVSGASHGTAASNTITLGGGAGNVTVVTDGTSVGPIAFNTDDTQTALDVISALNANATFAAKATASDGGAGVITITWDTPGTVGNAKTLTASRTAGTATVGGNGTTLGGGADTSVTVTINGVELTVNTTTTTTDDDVAAAITSAINGSANALIDGVVEAVTAGSDSEINAVEAGTGGNMITLSVSGTGLTASGARLTGGTDDTTAYTFER